MNRILPPYIIASVWYQRITKDWLLPIGLLKFGPKAIRSRLIIDGFPRSGTTFLCENLKFSNFNISIASHSHGRILIKLGQLLGKEVFITIRNPIDACASLMTRDNFSAKQALQLYIHYYSFVQSIKYPINLVPFEAIENGELQRIFRQQGFQITNDFDSVSKLVIERELEFSGSANPMAIAIPHIDRMDKLAEARTLLLAQDEKLLARATSIYTKCLSIVR